MRVRQKVIELNQKRQCKEEPKVTDKDEKEKKIESSKERVTQV